MFGEGEYNLNTLKEVKATTTFFELTQEARGCQFNEPYEECTTKVTMNAIMEKCGCLPAPINIDKKVKHSPWLSLEFINVNFRFHFVQMNKNLV